MKSLRDVIWRLAPPNGILFGLSEKYSAAAGGRILFGQPQEFYFAVEVGKSFFTQPLNVIFQTSIRMGSSRMVLKVWRNWAPLAPSTTR